MHDRTSPKPGATVPIVFQRVFPLVAAAVLLACGGGSDPAASPATDAPAPAATATTAGTDQPASSDSPAGAVPAALEFSAPLVGGGEIELGALAGRPVLLWFWAPW